MWLMFYINITICFWNLNKLNISSVYHIAFVYKTSIRVKIMIMVKVERDVRLKDWHKGTIKIRPFL